MGICCMAQETQTGSVSTQKGGMGKEMGGRFKRKGIYVYLWLIHVEGDIWYGSKYLEVKLRIFK